MYNKEREEFIEKFRREKGLEPLFNKSKINISQISVKTQKNNSKNLNVMNKSQSKQKLGNSKGFNTINNVNTKLKGYLDKSYDEMNLNTSLAMNRFNNTDYVPRRWDYLHQLERVKQEKNKLKKRKQIEENELKIQQECTFSPIFYTKLSQRSKSKGQFERSTGKIKKISNIKTLENSINNNSIAHVNHTHNSSNLNELLNSNSITNNNIVKFINSKPSDNELLNCDVNQRTELWTRKKINKTENIKQQIQDREFEECVFKPKLCNYKRDKSNRLEDKLVDSEAFRVYVSRVRGLRETQEKEKIRSSSKPGTGNCWKKGITFCEEFNLSTEQNKNNPIGQSGIKSLQMPLTLSKHQLNNNYQPGNNRINSKSYKDLENEVLSNRAKQAYSQNICITNHESEIKIDKTMTYDKALDYLHNALLSLDI